MTDTSPCARCGRELNLRTYPCEYVYLRRKINGSRVICADGRACKDRRTAQK